MKIGFIGAGNMAAAMARGWSGSDEKVSVGFSDAGSGRAGKLAKELGAEQFDANAELAKWADLVVLAMKPAQLEEVAAALASSGKPVLSLLGATALARLEEALPESAVVRAMPNVGVEVRGGVICHAASERCDAELRQSVTTLLEALGTAIEVEDAQIDAATAVMGCSPAYFALVAETLVAAGIEEGLGEPEAVRMVAETVAGTGALLRARDAAAVRESVTSPGGSTEAGLKALEDGDVRGDLERAVGASLERMRG